MRASWSLFSSESLRKEWLFCWICEAKSIQLLHDTGGIVARCASLPCAFFSLICVHYFYQHRQMVARSSKPVCRSLSLLSLSSRTCRHLCVTYIDVQGSSKSTHRMLNRFSFQLTGLSFWSLILSLTFAHTPPGSFLDTVLNLSVLVPLLVLDHRPLDVWELK